MVVVMLRHSVSERHVLARLGARIGQLEGAPEVRISTKDADPFQWA
jgi:hypothetical protein